jgi:hypothetical protein
MLTRRLLLKTAQSHTPTLSVSAAPIQIPVIVAIRILPVCVVAAAPFGDKQEHAVARAPWLPSVGSTGDARGMNGGDRRAWDSCSQPHHPRPAAALHAMALLRLCLSASITAGRHRQPSPRRPPSSRRRPSTRPAPSLSSCSRAGARGRWATAHRAHHGGRQA